jgi:uridine kinase
MAFRNEYDFDSPEAIDFDILVERLKDIKAGYGHRQVSRCQLIMD